MKTALLASLFALAVSVTALGTSLVNRTRPDPDPVLLENTNIPLPGPDLASRVDALEKENAELRGRLAVLEVAAPLAQRAPADDLVTKAEFDALQEKVQARGAGSLDAAASAKDPLFKEQVAATLDEIRESEQAAKREATLRNRVDRLDALLPKLETQLGLTGPQSDALRTALTDRYERNAELERRWQAGESAEVLGEVKAEDYRVFQASLSSILTPEQIEGYGAAMGRSGGK